MNKEKFSGLLNKGFNRFNLDSYSKKALSSDILDNLWIYLNFLIEENKKYNLTALTSPREIISKHFFDSLSIVKCFNFKGRKNIIDIGTGAGFPGMVLKIFFPEINMCLCDSLRKRTTFLKKLAHKLELTTDIEIIHKRAEELGNENSYREKFDFVLSRAVATMNILSEYTIPFSLIEGKCVFYKGPEHVNELENAKASIKKLGGNIERVVKVNIPFIKEERYLVIINKKEKTPGKYPRRPGLPKKRPL